MQKINLRNDILSQVLVAYIVKEVTPDDSFDVSKKGGHNFLPVHPGFIANLLTVFFTRRTQRKICFSKKQWPYFCYLFHQYSDIFINWFILFLNEKYITHCIISQSLYDYTISTSMKTLRHIGDTQMNLYMNFILRYGNI